MFKTRNLFASNNVQSLIQAENERSTEFLLSLIDRCFLYNLHCFITSRAQPVCSSQFIPLIQSTMFWACTQLWTAICHLKVITDNYETWINEMMFAISLLIAGHTGRHTKIHHIMSLLHCRIHMATIAWVNVVSDSLMANIALIETAIIETLIITFYGKQ